MKYLHIKTLEGYQDADHLLLHACFQILTDFVEKEVDLLNKPAAARDQNDESLLELYAWWQAFLKNEKDEDEVYDEATKQLIRLISLRQILWS